MTGNLSVNDDFPDEFSRSRAGSIHAVVFNGYPTGKPTGSRLPSGNFGSNGMRRMGRNKTCPDFTTYHAVDADDDEEELDPSHLTFHESLGVGGQGEVFLTTWRRHRGDQMVEELVAVKKMGAGRKSVTQEDLMLKINHPNIVRCLGVTENASTFLMAMDYCSGGSLYNHIYNPRAKPLTYFQRVKVLCDVSEAMTYLHRRSPKIIHRDLKSPNVLLAHAVSDEDVEPEARITDFGVAVTAEAESPSKNYMTCVGTWRWTAPEVFCSCSYDEKVDVFSFAMLIYELITSKLPYSDKWPDSRTCATARAIHSITQGLRPIMKKRQFKGCPKFLRDMMLKCWSHNPSARPSFAEISAELKAKLPVLKVCTADGTEPDVSYPSFVCSEDGCWDGSDSDPPASNEGDERDLPPTPPQTVPDLRVPAPPSTNPDPPKMPMAPMTAPGGLWRFEPGNTPPTPPQSKNFQYETTTVFIETTQPHEIGNGVLDYLSSQFNICIKKASPQKCSFKADVFVDGVIACTMKVRIHSKVPIFEDSETSQAQQYAVRFQRRSGCAFTFHHVYDSAQMFLAKHFKVVQSEADVDQCQPDWFASDLSCAQPFMSLHDLPDIPDVPEDFQESFQQRDQQVPDFPQMMPLLAS
eukprot:gnl/MRDRNA2_/MRDRNA2_158460_c0_seq1.p1 gnl/MRDRNA2_/MRDRNA2_158460_c0~~gnl/MRDRNA2_/MRDRNA2_158460_c0_seq1.p1  ORF type:complete len:636 (-),score=94.30 gnl/MRDRNA2_/MRDRNA2_158460_c0_seq1:16-1923(-)